MRGLLRISNGLSAVLLLSACAAPMAAVTTGGSAGVLSYATSPSEPPPADLNAQMAQHESWCYSTMGEVYECFDQPQATSPGRLVNVDPPNRFPLNARAYNEALKQAQAAEAPKDLPKPPEDVGQLPLNSAVPALQPSEMTPVPQQALPEALVQPKSAAKPEAKAKKLRKKHKKHKARSKAKASNVPVLPPAAAPSTPVGKH